jgi:hypothetical protein
MINAMRHSLGLEIAAPGDKEGPVKSARFLFRVASALVVVASLLSVSGASASTGKPISGTQIIYFTGIWDRTWSAGSSGLSQTRGEISTGTFAFGGDGASLSGSVTRVDAPRYDADGNGRVQERITYVDPVKGVTCEGPASGVLVNWVLTASVAAHCSDGSTLHGTYQDYDVVFGPDGSVVGLKAAFNGFLLVPGR